MFGKSSLRRIAAIGVALVVLFANPALGEVIFAWAVVGNPGNAPDPISNVDKGSVAYTYRIAQHEVTNAQYVEFLNAVAATDPNGVYNPSMALNPIAGITRSGSSPTFSYELKSNMGDKPVNLVSFLDAMRFVNWLHNGQPTGAQDASTTEDGVYAINDGLSETRAVDARFFIPSEDEWYKAGYHRPSSLGGDVDDYWRYPTGSNSIPMMANASASGEISNSGSNVANYDKGADWNGLDGNVTTVGSAGALSESFYGTSDQAGNVGEWIEKLDSSTLRSVRGGWWTWDSWRMEAPFQEGFDPLSESLLLGFRVASPSPLVPAVSHWGLVILALLLFTMGTIIRETRVQRVA